MKKLIAIAVLALWPEGQSQVFTIGDPGTIAGVQQIVTAAATNSVRISNRTNVLISSRIIRISSKLP